MPLMSTRLVQSPREAQEAVQQVKREFMRHLLLTMLLVLSWLPAGAAEPWEMLPPTPAPMPAERAGHEYQSYSATPKQYDAFVEQISKMWADQPNWTDAQLKAITTPVLVVDGDHDEAIKREHTEYIAATIPGAGLLILPNTSHFAFLQDPALFNFAVLHFLGDR